ncbi:MAG: glycosyltransferase family A protein [Pseudomonadota bacterium]
MPKFSVIIPSYNRKRYLSECLDSVFTQSYPPFEVIVVDDGSTDGTVEILSADTRQLTLIRQQNAGPGAARNRGASIATGDYLAFLDSDDLWFSWTLETFATLISEAGNPSLLFGKYIDFAVADDLDCIVASQPRGSCYTDYLSSSSKGHYCGAGMMVISRAAFGKSDGFAEDFVNAEDHDLALQMGEATGFISVAEPITVAHRIHDSNEMGDLTKTIKGLERLVRKEASGSYPGGSPRQLARRTIITQHVRPAVMWALQSGKGRDARPLYDATLWWHVRQGRWRFLGATGVYALLDLIKRLAGRA